MDKKIDYSKYTYYALVAMLSIVTITFLPMLGSTVGIEMQFPSTGLELAVWCITKGMVAVINIMLFHCFHQQGKVRAKDNPLYREAWEKDFNNPHKSYVARSPRQWNAQQYGRKGVTVIITSLLSGFVLTQAVLTYDWVALISYVIALTIGIVFGIMQMFANYNYWIEEYPIWVNQEIMKEKNHGTNEEIRTSKS